jgi:TPR repeat protein
VIEGEGFYDTSRAVAWLCRAAGQNYGPAAEKLGQIYAGDVVEGVRLARRVGHKVAGTPTNQVIAFAWLSRAAQLGVTDARVSATGLWQRLTPVQQSDALAMTSGRKPLPCEWETVVGRS